uniref:C2H2-type domain-containing protein n=1 Tax=Naja naja TaxID=35670 RepID=A0A8C6X1P9_NAJNA
MNAWSVERPLLRVIHLFCIKGSTQERSQINAWNVERPLLIIMPLETTKRSIQERNHLNAWRKSFGQRGHLISHKMIHTREMPYKCIVCGKTFDQNGYLISHKRSHTGRSCINAWSVERRLLVALEPPL